MTVLIERFGGLIGGLLGTLPSTIVPAAAGIVAGSPSEEGFALAMCAVPAGMLVNAGFLWLWRALPPRLPAGSVGARLGAMVALTLGAWAAGAAVLVGLMGAAADAGIEPMATGLGSLALLVLLGVAASLRPLPAPRGTRRVGPVTLVARGGLAAVAIGVSVALSATGGALAAGMAAVFPAIFLTTMVALWLSQGEAVPTGAVGPMMLGSASVAAYALLVVVTFPALGVLGGSVVAWVLAALGVTAPATLWLRRRMVG
ncbi:MAG: hypothetical protein H6739_25725 [Alphaproteobacteria bacterium]|nr:hypothetical protein [Alphaproteobacteria bacterium]